MDQMKKNPLKQLEKLEEGGKKPFVVPVLTKYGTVKDVYRGPSCKAVLSNADDK